MNGNILWIGIRRKYYLIISTISSPYYDFLYEEKLYYLVYVLELITFEIMQGGGGVKRKEKGILNPSLPTESSGLTFLTFPTPLL